MPLTQCSSVSAFVSPREKYRNTARGREAAAGKARRHETETQTTIHDEVLGDEKGLCQHLAELVADNLGAGR